MITGYTLQNMIEEYDRIISTLEYTQNVKVQIICNDCGVKGEVRFHPMGLKCGGCGGYNTSTTGAGAGAGNAEQ
jgi:RING finger/CHY zinc finger protein 1